MLEAGKSKPVTPQTLFLAASTAKPIVAVAALHYVENGALNLDSDVNLSLVSWRVPENEFTEKEKVTLRRLLSHNAGVTVEGFRGYALGEEVPGLIQILNGEWPANSDPIRVDIVPGTQHRYSGGGYMIVQQLLEDAFGKSFPDILHDSVLEPWGMTTSTFESPLPEQFHFKAAAGHRADGTTIPGGWHTCPEMGPGASMWATSSDLAQFAIKVMQSYLGQPDGVLSQNMAVEMLTPQIANRGLGPVLLHDGDELFYFMHPVSDVTFRNRDSLFSGQSSIEDKRIALVKWITCRCSGLAPIPSGPVPFDIDQTFLKPLLPAEIGQHPHHHTDDHPPDHEITPLPF